MLLHRLGAGCSNIWGAEVQEVCLLASQWDSMGEISSWDQCCLQTAEGRSRKLARSTFVAIEPAW